LGDEIDAPTACAAGDDIWVINSFSKYFQMTGWRLGWMVVPEAYVRDIEKLAQNLTLCPSAPAQYGALAAFRAGNHRHPRSRRAEFRQRRDFLAPALERIGFRITARPEGAFYLYCDCSALCDDSFTLAETCWKRWRCRHTRGSILAATNRKSTSALPTPPASTVWPKPPSA
jgi:aspartate/methionine/tyrosine aminotransferase